MNRFVFLVLCLVALVSVSHAQMTFYLVDNFETGAVSDKWYVFDNASAVIEKNPAALKTDSVSEAAGDRSLHLTGSSSNWYVGGMGSIFDVNGAAYSRMNIDVFGSKSYGKVKVELFEKKSVAGTEEVKWVAELPVLGPGFTRLSIPFSAFASESKPPVFHGDKGGNISKIQLIFVASEQKGSIDYYVDNIMFTF